MERSNRRCKASRVGDPRRRGHRDGPARSASASARRSRVRRGPRDGVDVAFRGGAPSGPGFWYPPTVVLPGGTEDRIWREEVFGPVVAVMPFEDEADAVAHGQRQRLRALRLDLDPRRGPGDPGRARRRGRQPLGQQPLLGPLLDAVRRLQAVGLGRELGPDALDAFTEVKNVFISHRGLSTSHSDHPNPRTRRRAPWQAARGQGRRRHRRLPRHRPGDRAPLRAGRREGRRRRRRRRPARPWRPRSAACTCTAT